MGIFRRKRGDDATATVSDTPASRTASDASEVPAQAARPGATGDASDDAGGTEVLDRSTSGPFDVGEVASGDGYVDLGALWLPAIPGLMLTMEVDETTGEVTAVRVHHGESVLQLQAFAAPTSSGIWAEIRDELVSGIGGQGGQVDTPLGPLGGEVVATLSAGGADGRNRQVMRFLGVDGPRWFLRGVISGPAASDADLAAPLVELMRAVVVVRGSDPMGPRELLALTMPPEPTDDPAPVEPAAAGGTSTDDLNPFVRGPEITETR